MEDILQEIIEKQKESLKKYDNKNIRTKNTIFYPIDENNADNIFTYSSEEFNKTKNDNKTSVANTVKDIAKETKKEKVTHEKVEKFDDFLLNLSKKFDRDEVSKKQKENENYLRRKNAAEKKKVIQKVYTYLFDSLYNYSLCFEEFEEIVSKFPSFVKTLPEIKTEPSKPNTRDFIYKIRTVSLIQKINIFAYQIGQYNFSLIAKRVVDSDIFSEYSPDELAILVSKEYEGTELDYAALLNLFDIAEADMNGSIVFENTIKDNTVKKEEQPVNKKEQRKKSLGFSSFNLKK